MNDQIYTVYHLTIRPENFTKFRALAEQIVSASADEPDTLTYEWLVNEEKTAAHIVERYRTAGLLPHVENTFAPRAEEFLSLATIDRLYVYGDPTPEIRTKLDPFGPIYLSSIAGFTR